MIREIPYRIPKSMSFRYILLAHSDSCNIVVFSKLLDDHTIMAHFSFAQHHSQQRLNSQFSTAFSSAQSHSTSGTRHVLLRLRRFSPLSYVNDYWATESITGTASTANTMHQPITKIRSHVAFARKLDMTNTIFHTLHRSVIVIATLMKTSPN